MTNPIAKNLIEQKHQLYRTIWGKLSNEGREKVSTKSQFAVSYCKAIAASSGIPKGVPASTIYDLCQFAGEELETEVSEITKLLKHG